MVWRWGLHDNVEEKSRNSCGRPVPNPSCDNAAGDAQAFEHLVFWSRAGRGQTRPATAWPGKITWLRYEKRARPQPPGRGMHAKVEVAFAFSTSVSIV